MNKENANLTPLSSLGDFTDGSGVVLSSRWLNPLEWEPDATAFIQMQFPDNDMRHTFLLNAHSEVELPSFKNGPLPNKDSGIARGGRNAEIDLNYLNRDGGLSVLAQDTLGKSHEHNQQFLESFIARNLLKTLDVVDRPAEQ